MFVNVKNTSFLRFRWMLFRMVSSCFFFNFHYISLPNDFSGWETQVSQPVNLFGTFCVGGSLDALEGHYILFFNCEV